jgi:rubredoxin
VNNLLVASSSLGPIRGGCMDDVQLAKKYLLGEHACKFCGHVGFEYDDNPVRYDVNPYALELYDDGTEYWICRECSEQLADDV